MAQDTNAKINFLIVPMTEGPVRLGTPLTSKAKHALPNDRAFLQHLPTCFLQKGTRPRATLANSQSRGTLTLLVSMGKEVIQQLRDNLNKGTS